MITINLTQEISAPTKQVRQILLDHALLARFFNAKFSLVKIQNTGELVGGKGAIRQVSIGKVVFKEQIISASDQHICYRIMGNRPVSEHQGDIKLIAQGIKNTTTQLNYRIKFVGPKWLPDFLLKYFVERDINNAMNKLAKHFLANNSLAEKDSIGHGI